MLFLLAANVANDQWRFMFKTTMIQKINFLHINYSKGAVRATIYLLAFNTFNLINITDSLN